MSGGWIAMDGGQSAIRLRASWAATDVSGDGYHHDPSRVGRLIDAFVPLIEGLEAGPGVDVVAVGHTGLPMDANERAEIARTLFDTTNADVVHLTADVVTAHLGAFEGRPGVVLSAGTGAVALGANAEGETARVDGSGSRFGDAGSAFAIGRSAIEVALRDLDGRTVAPALAQAAREQYGRDLANATWDLYAAPDLVDRVARFAPAVLAAAAAGDPPARGIVDAAADELALSVSTAAAPFRGAPFDVAVTGRLLSGGNPLAVRFADVLTETCPGAQLVGALGGALDGAARLAQSGPGLLTSHVHSYRRESS